MTCINNQGLIKLTIIKQLSIKQNYTHQMKKHIASIQSTKAEDYSISYTQQAHKKPHLINSIQKLFKDLHQILKLRSNFLFRDIETILSSNQPFLKYIFAIQTAQQLWQIITPSSKNESLKQKQQISFLVKMVIIMNKMKKDCGDQGKIKQFQKIKAAIQVLEQHIAQFEKQIRIKKESDQVHQTLEQKKLREFNFLQYQKYLKNDLMKKQDFMHRSFQKKVNDDQRNKQLELQENQFKHNYKAKPSKFLSQAKNVSLKAKLAPYAHQKMRAYDYRTLNSSLSKTLDLQTSRKFSVIQNMKRQERLKLHRFHQKRYSVIQDKITEQKNRAQRQIQRRRYQLQKSQQIKMFKLEEINHKIRQQRVTSLQRSMNAYNIHEQSRKIKQILRDHKEAVQFSSSIEDVVNLKTTNQINSPKYLTLASQMTKPVHEQHAKKRQKLYEKKILRKFNENQQQEQISKQKTLRNDRSLVQLYNNELEQIGKKQQKAI